MPDMTFADTLAANSAQLNAVDLIGSPRTVTIAEVRIVKSEIKQPVHIVLAEFGPGRLWKPPATVRRIIAGAWGTDSSQYIGRRITLVFDANVYYAGKKQGGIRPIAMSHIDEPFEVDLSEKRGELKKFVIQPLPTAAPQPTDTSGRKWLAELKLAGDHLDAIKALGIAARTAHASAPIIDAIMTEYRRVEAAGATAESGAEG